MKEAVAFILDASPSMNLPYPNGDDCKTEEGVSSRSGSKTRLDCAKEAIETMISDLMIQSTTNEVTVIVCKTAETAHHAVASGVDIQEAYGDHEVPFPNLTELSDGVAKPTVDLLRRIAQIETVSEEQAKDLRGDFCDAIILAADALYKKTHKRKYQRKIVLFTDAGHEVVMDTTQTLEMIDSLRDMECRLEVIGMDFESSSAAVYDEPAAAPGNEENGEKRIKLEDDHSDSGSKPLVKKEDVSDDETMDGEDDGSGTEDGDEEDDEKEEMDCFVYSEKKDRKGLLRSLTEKIGGKVVAASTLQEILNLNKGKRVKVSRPTAIDFRIAPGVSFKVKYMLHAKKEAFPRTKTEVVLVDEETMEPLKDSEGRELTDEVTTVVQFVDEQNPQDTVDEESRTTAVRYGSDLVPMSIFDYEGLKDASDPGPRLEILGYMERRAIPDVYFMGPGYIFSGHTSQKACAMIAALTKALHRLRKVAICTLLKSSKSAEAILGALLPFTEPNLSEPIRLLFLQLPFAGDVKSFSMPSFEDILEESTDEQAQAADDLIDSLMLPPDKLQSGKLPSPFHRAWYQTVVKRSVDPTAPLVKVRSEDADPMATPPEILSKAQSALDRFAAAFPLTVKKTVKAKKGRKGRRILTHKDYMED